jgi:hypothetical protein
MSVLGQDLIGKSDTEAREVLILTNYVSSLFSVSHLDAILHHGCSGEILIET